MNIEKANEFLRLLNKAKISDGFVKYKDIFDIRSSYLIYYQNKLSLNKSINSFNKKFLDFKNYKDSDILRWKKQRIIVKDLYNLISSAQNFAEHINKANTIRDKDILFKFFRELRNMLVHNSSFDLVSRRIYPSEIHKSEIFVFQSMSKDDFEEFLKNAITKESNKNKPKNYYLNYLKEVSLYLDSLEVGFNFEILLNKYCIEIDNLYNTHLLDFVKRNIIALEDYNAKVEEVHQFVTNLPINKTQLRYLKYLLFKARLS